MKHYGDITKLSGRDLPPVDIITGGSPCQDLSVAGKREGLSGERSGLFMEQIRIVKEMRDEYRRTHECNPRDIKPRYMVWENVPGALSSGVPKGGDFQVVLTEIVRIAEPGAPPVPLPEKGKWSKSGCLMGNGWSLAYRIHDAQFWGVPQRRRRIALVADFGGTSAPEILFERKSMSGNPESGREEKQDSAGDSEDSSGEPGESVISFQERAGKPGGGKGILIQDDHVGALSTFNNQRVLHKCLNPWDIQSKHVQPEEGIAEALWAGEARWAGGESYVLKKNE